LGVIVLGVIVLGMIVLRGGRRSPLVTAAQRQRERHHP
jgi:hypothetical protein